MLSKWLDGEPADSIYRNKRTIYYSTIKQDCQRCFFTFRQTNYKYLFWSGNNMIFWLVKNIFDPISIWSPFKIQNNLQKSKCSIFSFPLAIELFKFPELYLSRNACCTRGYKLEKLEYFLKINNIISKTFDN